LNGKNAKLARKAANAAARQTGEIAGNVTGMVLEYAKKIEERVEVLEPAVGHLEAKARHWDSFRLRSFWARLTWLLTGR